MCIYRERERESAKQNDRNGGGAGPLTATTEIEKYSKKYVPALPALPS